MLKGDHSFHRRWEIILSDNKTSLQKQPIYIRHFFLILVLLGLLGGFLALTVPSWKSWEEIPCIGFIGSFLRSFIPPSDTEKYPEGKVIADLRQHILYITGGIIAILTLLQTNWKNQVDRRKVEDDIKKNSNDHNRQVHAERRSRYTKAAEQLGDEKATVRLGGIYTLVGLVDEWLSDDALGSKEQQKEGQVIINSLCSYIRSPFPLAAKIEEYEARKELEKLQKTESEKLSKEESSRLHLLLKRFKDSDEYEKPKDITTDYAKFHEEQDVRRTIFVEMSKRSSTFTKNDKGEIIETVPGIWSDFDFDFTQAPIFYPLNSITIEKANFHTATFYVDANFVDTVFIQDADFSDATFTNRGVFAKTTFAREANFWRAKFKHNATFMSTTFTQKAKFTGTTFTQDAYFTGVSFLENAYFDKAHIFTNNERFSLPTTFAQNVRFRFVSFNGKADFRGAIFAKNAEFRGIHFSDDPIFVPNFVSKNAAKKVSAQFSAQSDPQDYVFSAPQSSKPVTLGQATLLGKPFIIPVGTVLFDPDSWDEEKQEYTHVSEPAKPLENSDTEEEKPAG